MIKAGMTVSRKNGYVVAVITVSCATRAPTARGVAHMHRKMHHHDIFASPAARTNFGNAAFRQPRVAPVSRGLTAMDIAVSNYRHVAPY